MLDPFSWKCWSKCPCSIGKYKNPLSQEQWKLTILRGIDTETVSLLRFDSWAGMALARASRIQDKLNSNELKSDVPIWKHSQAVLNCFKRALEIDSSNLSLWIEYGNISYALHSFASRQLKQWRNELPPEVVKQVRHMLINHIHLCCVHVYVRRVNLTVTLCHFWLSQIRISSAKLSDLSH